MKERERQMTTNFFRNGSVAGTKKGSSIGGERLERLPLGSPINAGIPECLRSPDIQCIEPGTPCRSIFALNSSARQIYFQNETLAEPWTAPNHSPSSRGRFASGVC
jgi:hypothetical protein